MKTRKEHWPLLSFKEYENQINPNPIYQRTEGVWKSEQCQMLIDSLLRQIDIPKIYLRENNESEYSYEIIDGQQRMRSIWDFLNNKFTLHEYAGNILIGKDMYEVAECNYNGLDSKLKIERIHKYTLDVIIIYEASEDEIADLFYRLNNGTPLSPAEVRNSMPGYMTNVIRDLSKHPFFNKVGFTNKRFSHHQVCAQMMFLEQSRGIEETRDRNLTKMYTDYSNSVPKRLIENCKNTLDMLDLIFPNKSKLISRVTTINLYLLISYLLKNTKVPKSFPKDFYNWFIQSEPFRAKNSEYLLYSKSAVNSKKSIEGRFKILLQDLFAHFSTLGLVKLDPNRLFNDKQKVEIFARDKGVCQICFKNVTEHEWSADHKIPWIKGGTTTINNGQVLCKKCNLKKNDKLW